MKVHALKSAAICVALLAVTPALGQAQVAPAAGQAGRTDPKAPPPPKAKVASTAQVYNVTADVNVLAESKTAMDAAVCNLSDTLGKGVMKKGDGLGNEGFAVPARECAVVKGIYLLDLNIKDTPAPWKAIVSVSPAAK